jgi:HNH endonuclease
VNPDHYRVSETGCWIWLRGKTSAGYGQVGKEYAHRLVYIERHGSIPSGYQIDHLCHTLAVQRGECAGGRTCPHRPCVNPDHLEAVTQQENIRRGPAAQRACVKGHIYDESNTFYDGRGARRCRWCARDLNAERARQRKKVRHISRELHYYIGHTPVHVSPGRWDCKCGERLARTKEAALESMREHRRDLASAAERRPTGA